MICVCMPIYSPIMSYQPTCLNMQFFVKSYIFLKEAKFYFYLFIFRIHQIIMCRSSLDPLRTMLRWP